MDKLLAGIRPAYLGMVLGVLLSIACSTYIADNSVNIMTIIIGLLDFMLLWKFKTSIPKIILLSAGMGAVLFGIIPLLR